MYTSPRWCFAAVPVAQRANRRRAAVSLCCSRADFRISGWYCGPNEDPAETIKREIEKKPLPAQRWKN